MTISESLSISASTGKPVRCTHRKAQNHTAECACSGTGMVIACGNCNGSGFDPHKQKACSRCAGNGALPYQTPKK